MDSDEIENPLAAFDLLDDDTRLGILRALAEFQRESPRDPAVGFSELRRAVGVRDSGNFNYHLDRLVGRFVERGDEGYSLTPAGMQVVGTAMAGSYDRTTERGPVDLGETCPVCGDQLRATYDDGVLEVACGGTHFFRDALPSGALQGRSIEDALVLLTRKAEHDLYVARTGICPLCYGDLVWDPRVVDEPAVDRLFVGTCERCGWLIETTAGATLVRHPAVVSFYHDHGVDVHRQPFWLLGLATDEFATVVSEEPLRVQITLEEAADRLTVTLDDQLDLVDPPRRESIES